MFCGVFLNQSYAEGGGHESKLRRGGVILRGKLWKPSESTWHTKLVEKLSRAAATCRQVVEKLSNNCRNVIEQMSNNVEQLSVPKSCRKAAAASTTTIRWVVGALHFCLASRGTGIGPLIGRLTVTSARLKLLGITTHSLQLSRWEKTKVEGCPKTGLQ